MLKPNEIDAKMSEITVKPRRMTDLLLTLFR